MQGKKRTILCILGVLIICNILLLVWMITQRQKTVSSLSEVRISDSQDAAAEQKISEDMQHISINEAPHFVLPEGQGDLRIEVAEECQYAYFVTYSLVDTQQQVLEAGLISPGEYVLGKPLDVPLKAGTYPVIALFTAYDIETQKEVGKAAQAMEFYVDAEI